MTYNVEPTDGTDLGTFETATGTLVMYSPGAAQADEWIESDTYVTVGPKDENTETEGPIKEFQDWLDENSPE